MVETKDILNKIFGFMLVIELRKDLYLRRIFLCICTNPIHGGEKVYKEVSYYDLKKEKF